MLHHTTYNLTFSFFVLYTLNLNITQHKCQIGSQELILWCLRTFPPAAETLFFLNRFCILSGAQIRGESFNQELRRYWNSGIVFHENRTNVRRTRDWARSDVGVKNLICSFVKAKRMFILQNWNLPSVRNCLFGLSIAALFSDQPSGVDDEVDMYIKSNIKYLIITKPI